MKESTKDHLINLLTEQNEALSQKIEFYEKWFQMYHQERQQDAELHKIKLQIQELTLKNQHHDH